MHANLPCSSMGRQQPLPIRMSLVLLVGEERKSGWNGCLFREPAINRSHDVSAETFLLIKAGGSLT